MVYPEVYHIALTKQEHCLLQQLIQVGNRLAHLYLGVNPICTEYFEWHRHLSKLYPKLIDLEESAKPQDDAVDDDINKPINATKILH